MGKRRTRGHGSGRARARETRAGCPHPLQWQDIVVDTEGSQDTGVCPCCGSVSRVVWGGAAISGEDLVRYYVQWTVGEVSKHGANFDLILGEWGDGVPDDGRVSVSLAYRLFEGGPSLMVIDAGLRPMSGMPFAGRPLSRTEVIGTPLAPVVFAIVDAIYMKDPRLEELAPGLRPIEMPGLVPTQ